MCELGKYQAKAGAEICLDCNRYLDFENGELLKRETVHTSVDG